MSYTPVSTMSTAGFLTSPKLMMDYLFRCFLASEKSQSTYSTVASLPSILAEHTTDINAVTSTIQSQLTTLYNSHFDSSTITVTADPWPEDTSQWLLRFNIVVISNGAPYTLDQLIKPTQDGFTFYQVGT